MHFVRVSFGHAKVLVELSVATINSFLYWIFVFQLNFDLVDLRYISLGKGSDLFKHDYSLCFTLPFDCSVIWRRLTLSSCCVFKQIVYLILNSLLNVEGDS